MEEKVTYFLYSEEQLQERNKILSKQGKEFIPGTVYVGNKRLEYTQMSDKATIDRFIDTQIVAKMQGTTRLKYSTPKTQKKKGL